MGDAILKKTASREDFLKYLESIQGKAQFIDGEIFDMAGGTESHSLISTNVTASLVNALSDSNCRVYNSDLMVEVAWGSSLLFPDLSVVCGKTEFADGRKDIIRNPGVVIEITSPSSAVYDRGGKLLKYRSLDSLREYIIIEQGIMQVDVFSRNADRDWVHAVFQDPQNVVVVPSLGLELPMTGIYRNVEFEVIR